MICLIIGTVLVAMSWAENTGDAKINFSVTLGNAYRRLQEDRKIALLGLIQSFFEGERDTGRYMLISRRESCRAM